MIVKFDLYDLLIIEHVPKSKVPFNKNNFIFITFQKLEKILNEYDQVKLKTKSKSYSVIRELKQRQNSKETSDVGDEKSAEQSPITEDNYDISNDCAKAEPKEDIRRLRFEEKPSKCIKNQYKYLEVMVHFSLVFVFAELIFLIYLLIGVYLPLGLVFLCTCLAMVGGFTVKVSFKLLLV